jgi:hypothetical protein
MGYQCGMLWGAALAAGAQAYRLFGASPQAEASAVFVSQRLVDIFRARTNEINCMEITDLNIQEGKGALKFILKGGPIGCFRHAAGYAKEVRSGIDAAFSEDRFESLSQPVSCAAMVAKKMGASDLHAVMAAGFAGGIGLSGGGCGALGASIWIRSMSQPAEMDGFSFSNTWIGDMIEKYLECSDYEFECVNVVGRKFEDVADHANYLHQGGCLKIIETLAEINFS